MTELFDANRSQPDPAGPDRSWPELLAELLRGHRLDAMEAEALLGRVLAGDAPPPVLGAMLVLMRQRGETVEELTGFARAMQAAMVEVPVHEEVVDTCGTGGDRHGTINVSTGAALVVAAAGHPVLKHGGRAASSKAGSADVLEALGVPIDLGPEELVAAVTHHGFGFALATRFHPAMAQVAPVRRALGVPTAFNFLGPLVNPGRARHQLVGVFDASMAPLMAEVLAALGSAHALVVTGEDGMDEISLVAPTHVVEVRVGEGLRSYVLEPEALGLRRAELGALRGGDAAANARTLAAILASEIRDARRDLVALNAAGALVAADRVATVAEGFELAMATLDSGAAARLLEAVATSREEPARRAEEGASPRERRLFG
jgi:anthranilate phosphoribosyltransferase